MIFFCLFTNFFRKLSIGYFVKINIWHKCFGQIEFSIKNFQIEKNPFVLIKKTVVWELLAGIPLTRNFYGSLILVGM